MMLGVSRPTLNKELQAMPRGPCPHIAEHFTIAGKKLLTVDSTFRPARRQTAAWVSPIHPSDSVSSKEYGSMNANARELAASFDIEKLTGEFYADPYATYRALREHEPVKLLPNGSYFLTRYDDLVSAYKNTKLFSSDKKKEFLPKYGDSLLYEHHTTSLVFNDAPAHTRVRRLIMGALSPRAIAEMEPDLIALVDRLLDALAAKGSVDLIGDFASAIPVQVIGNLLDVPQEEREPLRDWSLAILGALEPVIGPEVFARGNKAVKDFLAYLEILVERRRAKPGNPERDVLTRLIQGEDNGERLTSKELLQNCIFLLNAGHETTTNLIGNGLVALSGNPTQKNG
jgi:cytochrome P450